MLEYVGEDVVIADSDDELIDGLAFLDGMIEFGDLAAQESAEELKAKLLEAGASGDVQEMVRIAALLKKKQKKEGDQESRFQVSGGRSFLRWIQKTTGDGFIAHFRRLIEEATAEMSIADTRHFDPATGEKVARIRPAELIEKDVDILFAFALRRTAAGVGIHFIDGTATVYDPKKNKNLAVKFTGAGKDLLNQNVRIRKKLKESGYPPSPQPQYLDMPVPAPFKSWDEVEYYRIAAMWQSLPKATLSRVYPAAVPWRQSRGSALSVLNRWYKEAKGAVPEFWTEEGVAAQKVMDVQIKGDPFKTPWDKLWNEERIARGEAGIKEPGDPEWSQRSEEKREAVRDEAAEWRQKYVAQKKVAGEDVLTVDKAKGPKEVEMPGEGEEGDAPKEA